MEFEALEIRRGAHTVLRCVATKEVSRQTRMPAALIVRGKVRALHPALTIASLEAPTRSAAHVASPKEPKRSAPIPATSPTLSPTLSAMVPGLVGGGWGEGAGRWCRLRGVLALQGRFEWTLGEGGVRWCKPNIERAGVGTRGEGQGWKLPAHTGLSTEWADR